MRISLIRCTHLGVHANQPTATVQEFLPLVGMPHNPFCSSGAGSLALVVLKEIYNKYEFFKIKLQIIY